MPAQISSYGSIIYLALLFVVLYFIMIRPQKKREKEARAMLAALKTGDEIVTIGGVIGKIASIKDDVVTIEVGADRTKLVFERSAIRNLRNS